MGNFRNGNRSFGGSSSRSGGSRFGGRGGFGGRDSGSRFGSGGRNFDRRPVEMHDAICSKCNKQCQVPFRPTGDKPVFCSDCFGQNGGSRSDSRPIRQESSPNQSNELKQINLKLDKIISILKELELDDGDEDDDMADDLTEDLDDNEKVLVKGVEADLNEDPESEDNDDEDEKKD